MTEATTLTGALGNAEPLYVLPKDDVAECVISPALSVCDSADLMVGFFSSQSFAEIAPGLAAYLRQSSQPLRLVVSPYLSTDDQAALIEGSQGAARLAENKLSAGLPDASALAKHTLECLAWLVAEGRLEFKIALMRNALFHPKVWLFRDGLNVAALHGSANMTASGLGRNREQLSLARSWSGAEGERVCRRLQEEFDLLWHGGDETCIVVDLPKALEERLVRDYRADRMPSENDFHRLWLQARAVDGAATTSSSKAKPVEFAVPAWLDYRSGDFAHQGDAIDAWMTADKRGILEMCTGSGKTLTALVCACLLHKQLGSLLIVVAAPYKVLVRQWCDEMAHFGLKPIDITALAGPKGRDRVIAEARRRLAMKISPVEALVVSNDTLVTPEFQAQIEAIDGPKILIADECHNLGAAGFISSPPEMFNYRLGLSATPIRQYDEEGTDRLFDYFGKPCFSFGLEQAIGKCLTPYDYHVHFVSLHHLEMQEWREISEEIARHTWKIEAGIEDEYLSSLFLKRRRVLETAKSKILKLKSLLCEESRRDIRNTLIYTTDKDPEQLVYVNRLLGELDLRFHQLTAEETVNAGKAQQILSSFQGGSIQIITAKRVLDEGVNIPQIERAYILASTTVRRQWVQRRGRLLRICKQINKTHATIHDLVALPPDAFDGSPLDPDCRRIVNSELDRVWEFARLSRNAATSGGAFTKVEELRALLKGDS